MCISCGARPCWARTVSCFKCGEPRPRGSGGGGGTGGTGGGGKGTAKGASAAVRRDEYLGPRGAGGSRPMLGGRAASQQAAGKGGDQRGGGATTRRTAAMAGDATSNGKGRQQATAVDADGFRAVSRQTWPRVGNMPSSLREVAADVASAPTSWAQVVQRPPAPPSPPAPVADADDDDDNHGDGEMAIDDDDDQQRVLGATISDHDSDDDGGDDGADGEEEEDGSAGAAVASEEDLRRLWEDSKEACRVLERNPRTPPTMVAAARRERDQAEANWRASKRPHPLHKRMRWAQRAYDAAVLKQQTHQQELDEFEEESARKRRVLLERAQVDKERTARKLQALDEILKQGGHRPPSDAERAAQIAATGIAEDLGPALAAVAEKLPDSSPAWMELQAALSTLATVEDVLRGTARPQQHVDAAAPCPLQFDISDATAGGGEARAGEGTSTSGRADQLETQSGGGGGAPQAPRVGSARAVMDAGRPGAAQADGPKWRGPRAGDNRWGGQVWRKQCGGPTCAADGTNAGTGDVVGEAGNGARVPSSSLHAKEQAQKLLEQKAILLAAQTKEREAAEAARVQAMEALRVQQVQQEQQRQAAADAAAAADALRLAQRAMAEAEAHEAARQEKERQELVARTAPEELRRAQELHAQQTAIAAAGFGTAQAAAGAELLRAAVPSAQLQTSGGADDDAARIMDMSPEELAELQRGSMDVGRCPW